jgi:aerobic-type carbon monoxide dehydrogenase small subunit (CoxS/CutS family)
MTKDVTFRVNGKPVTATADQITLSLLEFLNEDLGLTGPKLCCGIGVCRACTVVEEDGNTGHLNAMRTCIAPVESLSNKRILTIEDVARNGKLHPIQDAFLRHFSFQCGYCVSGFVMSSIALIDKLKRDPTPEHRLDAEIENAIGDHICRCTGYANYHAAIKGVLKSWPGLVH